METEPTSPEASQLDKEIASLRKQAASLRKALQIQCSTILSSASTSRLIRSSSSPAAGRRPGRPDAASSGLRSRSTQQQAYMQQCVYRISAPVTSFKVRDPDPNAVDGGHVLGLRFEIMSRGQFLRPYYVMLNRPYAGSRHLRVHRHTVPPAVPLAGLAARHLPQPSRAGAGNGSRNSSRNSSSAADQDLDRFARTLRREIVRYHNRLGVSADLRRRLGLRERGAQAAAPNALVEAGIADIEAKQISLAWANNKTGRLVMDDDGNVVKFVVFGSDGRDWEASSAIFSKHDTIDDVARKLEERLAESLG
ncbi:Centromere protein Cenp-O [Metarhizium album ARSEF 1941]|uniref:Centromere protein Cenp-O n=1 Tax=Metarhizium album (strain ARSEF 1941) TaxID=1081103 RepID=A0A0B2WYW0_METAS|nr:Centromere protein Cenp-O [Metarhizium album ARSEF 1941]KHN98734.1 Centromere protein Cenp-O [Metarhizium album ARSEF 1941]